MTPQPQPQTQNIQPAEDSAAHAVAADTARFARIRDLFGRACDLDPEARTALLDRECAADPDLRAGVERLLEAERSAPDFSDPDRGAVIRALLADDPLASGLASIGTYRLRGTLGRGGMGVVYLAEQSNPARDVALKVLPAGPDSAGLATWFGREIRLLARLEHPGIARIYEAGSATTPRGLVSYFAMEYITGPRLLDYARDRSLTHRERAAVIAAAADAVQHAHTKGIVHRDLKPANILVREPAADAPQAPPQPVILDFGVARLADPDHPAPIAESGLFIGTLSSMSPEQLAGDNDAVDARADVYALGVILFELLTGRLPHDLRGKTPEQAARILRDEPTPTLPASVDPDLALITGRALEKDRDRRYQTAADLAADLRRFLREEPILARRPSAPYLLRKFTARNRALVVTAAAGILALAGGLAASAALYIREQHAHARAEELFTLEQAARRAADDSDRLNGAIRGYLIDGLLMAAAPDRMGHDVKMLDVLPKAIESLHDRFKDNPEVEAAIRADLARVLAAVGKYADSERQWSLALPLLEQTAGPDSKPAIAALLGRALALHELHHRWEAIRLATDALARARRTPGAEGLAIHALSRIGASYEAEGRHGAALKHLREGLALADAAPEQNADVIPALLTNINSAEKRLGHPEEVVALSRRIAGLADAHGGPDSPSAIMARHNLILGLLQAGHAEEAATLAGPLPAAAEHAFAPGHPARAQVHRICGDAMLAVGRREEAERLLTTAAGEFAAAPTDVSVDRELCFDGLWQLYAAWPGHDAEFREAATQAFASRLQHTPRGRNFAFGQFFTALATASTGTPTAALPETADVASDPDAPATDTPTSTSTSTPNPDASPASDPTPWLEAVWLRRDEWAPPDHPSRALFFTNFARLSRRLSLRPHFDEAIALAQAALPYAKRAAPIESELRALTQPTP